MKRIIFVYLLMTIMTSTGLVWNIGSGGAAVAIAAESETGATVGVDQLMKQIDKYRGSVSIEGVVSAVSPKDQMLSLIDTQEFKRCRVTTCATLTLPVRWAGAMPSIKDQVRVEGEIKENRGKLVFEAKTLQGAALQ